MFQPADQVHDLGSPGSGVEHLDRGDSAERLGGLLQPAGSGIATAFKQRQAARKVEAIW